MMRHGIATCSSTRRARRRTTQRGAALARVAAAVMVGLLFASGAPVRAQTGAPSPGTPSPGAVPSTYVLGPEDVLEISVWGYPDLTRVVAVLPDGRISVPLVGAVMAAGQTVEQLTRTLVRGFARYIREPQVTVIVKEFRKVRASVLGQVARPGTYALPPGARLLDLISAAGGLTEVASVGDAQLLRGGRPAVTVDLDRVLAGDPEANVELTGGETLVVREDLVNIVNVAGEVVKPGRYRLKGEMRVLDVLLLAGGLTEKASVTAARLVRGGEAHSLALDALLLRQDMSHNVRLRPGDTLLVPEETNNKIYVLGDVNSPGVFPLRGEVTLLQAVAMAGGPVQRGPATARTIHIVRRGAVERAVVAGAASGIRVEALPGGRALISADLQMLLRNGGTRDTTVQPGDVIVVPQSGLTGLQIALNILAGLAWPFRW
ncbi:MAG: SLBB domain-containing protein [Armatimonadota bacterium]|nr:SLBB domain-containing protein [Armatimonadota bacterium]MDR7520462.1 SLBB domain-containing protein [Armatimonadota bacterium]MDR7549213.1 SLBB domain-containing protein [Armatimonadota bacterium]